MPTEHVKKPKLFYPQDVQEATEPFCTPRDVDNLIGAMKPYMANPEESMSLDGSIAEGRRFLDVRMGSQGFFVPFTSIVAARKEGEKGWGILAAGVLEKLRDLHSLSPQRVFALADIYEEAERCVVRIAREGLTPKEFDALQVVVLEATGLLRDSTAKSKARVNVYVEELGKTLRAGLEAANA